jgi:hypothetical protein
MAETRYEDLYDAAAVVGTEQSLVGRLDAAVLGITSRPDEVKRVTGLAGRCSNTGYLIARLAGKTVLTMGLATLNALTSFAALDIPVPVGQTLAFYEQSSSGTGACEVIIQYTIGG